MIEKKQEIPIRSSRSGIEGFGPFLWHGAFLALTMAMVDLNTVLPSLVSRLTANTVAFGAIYSVMIGAPLLFNLPFSKLQGKSKKRRKYLLVGIYARSASFVGMAMVLLVWSQASPMRAYWGFLILVLLFSASGGFAGIAYSELIGRTIPEARRSDLYAYRQFLGGLMALASGIAVARIFSPGVLHYPLNYTTALLIGAAGLLIGSIGFWMIREGGATAPSAPEDSRPSRETTIGILRRDSRLLRFIVIENLSGFSLMVLPFYLVYIQRTYDRASSYLGAYIISQTIGSLGSNILWSLIARRAGPRSVVALCIGLGGLLPIIALGLKPLGPAAYVALFFLVGFVLSGRNIGFEPYFLDITPESERTRYLGIRGSLGVLLAVLPLIGGELIEAIGFAPTFASVSGIMLGTAIYAIALNARQKA